MSEPRPVTLTGAGGDTIQGLALEPGPEAPAERQGRALVVVHEVFGLDAFTAGVLGQLAQAGYRVVAPDLYSREGLPGPAGTPEDPAPAWTGDQIRSAAAGLPDRRAVGDLEGAAAWLLEQGADPEGLGVLGFCRGGTLAFLAGCQSRRFQAVVDFYGRIAYPELSAQQPVQPLEMSLNLEAPLLGHFAGQDPSIPPEDVAALEQRLGAFAKAFELHTYPEAGHGFANPLRPASDPGAADLAWERTHRFLDEVLGA